MCVWYVVCVCVCCDGFSPLKHAQHSELLEICPKLEAIVRIYDVLCVCVCIYMCCSYSFCHCLCVKQLVCMYACVYVCMCVCIICMYICVYICMCVCVCVVYVVMSCSSRESMIYMADALRPDLPFVMNVLSDIVLYPQFVSVLCVCVYV